MNILLTFAVKEEAFDAPCVKKIITGVGKANAVYSLMKAIYNHKPDMIINMGTAGTIKYHVGDIFAATHFIDRDLKPLEIEGVISELNTNSKILLPSMISERRYTSDYIVNTGDDFVTSEVQTHGDVFDMESFALALACKNEGIDFVAVKYITDVIGCNSVKQWSYKLADARKSLRGYFDEYITPYIDN